MTPQEIAREAAEAIHALIEREADNQMYPHKSDLAAIITKHAAAISEENERLKREVEELNRRLEEQHKLYCEETKRHNETWAKIHAATGYLNKEFKKLPEDLLEAVKEVVFRVTLVELGRNSLQGEVSELRDKRKKLIEKLRESVNDTRELNDLAEALVDERGALRQWTEQAREVMQTALTIATEAPELNMANYDHDQVRHLNNAMIEIYQVLTAPNPTPPRPT